MHFRQRFLKLLGLIVLGLCAHMLLAPKDLFASPLSLPTLSSMYHLYLPFIETGKPPVQRMFFVSKRGNNENGQSWETAWNELDQINWAIIRPGDQIFLDGGDQEMVYTTSLVIQKSGIEGRPIKISKSTIPGRNGRVVIFGGRPTPLPYCRQVNYTPPPAGVRDDGIRVGDAKWVVIDGEQWSGIKVYGHKRYGISLSGGSDHVVIRHVEVYDNGSAIQDNGLWYPDLPGVNLSGTNNTFEKALIHNNGQDSFQSSGDLANFTLRSSWLYNNRMQPFSNAPFNLCRGPDGIQVYDGGEQHGFLIQDSVIGPGFAQGVVLGAPARQVGGRTQWATLHDVTLKNSLFLKSSSANIVSGFENDVAPRNWRIENVTSFRHDDTGWHNIFLEGTGHSIVNSIFYGSNITVPARAVNAQGNYQWATGGTRIGPEVDPLFADIESNNFAFRSCSRINSRGAMITSAAQLLGQSPPPVGPYPRPPLAGSHLFGVNLAGGEFGTSVPGTYAIDYIYPDRASLDYYRSKGIRLIRLPFRWERMQRSLYGPLDPEELGRMDHFIASACERGMLVIIEPHNFGRYHREIIGSPGVPNYAFEDFWRRMAQHFKDEPTIYAFSLTDEPYDTNGFWPEAAQAGINGIRSVDRTTLILVGGESSARDWPRYNRDLRVHDPANNFMYEVSQFFDADQTGRCRGNYDEEGAYPNRGVDWARPFVEWLRERNARGFFGGYGVPDNDPRWLTVLDNFMAYINANQVGGAYWAGGPWWGDYRLSVEPRNGQDRPQMSILVKYPGVFVEVNGTGPR